MSLEHLIYTDSLNSKRPHYWTMYGVVLLSNIPLESRDWQKNVNNITLAKKIALFCLIIFEDITCIGTQFPNCSFEDKSYNYCDMS